MGIAYHQASGNGQCVKDGALTKGLGPAFAVRGGVISALLARERVSGAEHFLEGEWGLYSIYFGGDYDRTTVLKALGEHYENTRVIIKPYPCCGGTHPAIDAAIKLKKKRER